MRFEDMWLVLFLGSITLASSASITEPSMPEAAPGFQSSCEIYELYYPSTNKCYTTGEQGPCGDNLILVSNAEGTGVCLCPPFGTFGSKCGYRPALLFTDHSSCYSAFDKGPCSHGEWLVPSKEDTLRATCEPNVCMALVRQEANDSMEAQDSFVFFHNGKCYETGTQAFCSKGEVALFSEEALLPMCFEEGTGACQLPPPVGSISATVLQLDCAEGETLGEDGQCEQVASF